MNQITNPAPLARYEMAAGAAIQHGNLVALNAEGKAVPAADAAGLTVIGAAQEIVENEVEVVSGIFGFANSGTNPVVRSDRGKACYVAGAATVDSVGGTNKVPAGIVVDVCDGEVYVDVTPAAIAAAK